MEAVAAAEEEEAESTSAATLCRPHALQNATWFLWLVRSCRRAAAARAWEETGVEEE